MTPITEGGERGHEEAIVWNGAPVRAWVPHLLASQDFEVGVRTARRTEQAVAAVRADVVEIHREAGDRLDAAAG